MNNYTGGSQKSVKQSRRKFKTITTMKTEIFKSKNGLKIIVEDRNEMISTMDWFNDLMSRSEFIIRPRPDGLPALYLKTINGNDYRYGLFTHPLTPTAEEEVEKMIQKAVDAFKEWYEVEEGMVHIYPKGYNKK